MMFDRLKATLLAGVASVSFASAAHADAFVSAISSAPVAVGTVTSGQSYFLNVLGETDLYQPSAVLIKPDGTPAYDLSVNAPGFMPSGTTQVPSSPGTYGVAGASVKLGALVGTYNATPTQPSDFFVIGSGGNYTATQSGTLYAMINSTTGSFPDLCGGAFVSFGSAPATTQKGFACASTPLATAPAPIATLLSGHYYSFSATGSEFIGGGTGTVNNPGGVAPQVNGYNTGQLLLSLVPNPSSSSQIMTVGADGAFKFTASSGGILYAWINAASYWQNTGGFMTQVTDIPEPMSLSLLLSGLGIVFASRARRQKAA